MNLWDGKDRQVLGTASSPRNPCSPPLELVTVTAPLPHTDSVPQDVPWL